MNKKSHILIEYHWQGINRAGHASQGIIQAQSREDAKIELRKQGIITRKMVSSRHFLFALKQKKIKPADITLFSRQLATLIKAGIPLIHSFNIIMKGDTNPRMQKLVENIKKSVESSLTLAESLRKHPRLFPALLCNLIDAGEKSGTLDTMLTRIALYKEKMESEKHKIKKALAYPIAVLILTSFVTSGMLIYMVPQFEALFHNFGAELPTFTRHVIGLSRFFNAYWPILCSLLTGMLLGFTFAQRHNRTFALSVDQLLLRLPLVGALLKETATARLARTLAITFAAGLPLTEALKTVAPAVGNRIYVDAMQHVIHEVATGLPLALAMENTKRFPSMATNLVAVGEETGALDEMLNKIADFYEEATDHTLQTLSSLLEPLIMALLGILVGGLVIAMYLPIIQLGSIV